MSYRLHQNALQIIFHIYMEYEPENEQYSTKKLKSPSRKEEVWDSFFFHFYIYHTVRTVHRWILIDFDNYSKSKRFFYCHYFIKRETKSSMNVIPFINISISNSWGLWRTILIFQKSFKVHKSNWKCVILIPVGISGKHRFFSLNWWDQSKMKIFSLVSLWLLHRIHFFDIHLRLCLSYAFLYAQSFAYLFIDNMQYATDPRTSVQISVIILMFRIVC